MAVIKKVIFAIILFFTIYPLSGQKRTEIGFNTGISFYNGDLNEAKLFYNPGYFFEVHLKRNFTERWAIRLALNNVKLRVNEAIFEFSQQFYDQNSFESQVWDVALQTEFNFLPYNPLQIRKEFLSPYIITGLGGLYIRGSSNTMSVSIPFGMGMKVKINKRIGVGCEWTFRKTFSDNIDGIQNIPGGDKRSLLHNNDWFSLFGFFVTYNISKLRIICPTYK